MCTPPSFETFLRPCVGNENTRCKYFNRQLIYSQYSRQRQADKNRAKVLERLEKRKQRGSTREKKKSTTPKLTQEECLGQLRQFVGLAPIAGIQKKTLVNITRVHTKFNPILAYIRFWVRLK